MRATASEELCVLTTSNEQCVAVKSCSIVAVVRSSEAGGCVWTGEQLFLLFARFTLLCVCSSSASQKCSSTSNCLRDQTAQLLGAISKTDTSCARQSLVSTIQPITSLQFQLHLKFQHPAIAPALPNSPSVRRPGSPNTDKMSTRRPQYVFYDDCHLVSLPD